MSSRAVFPHQTTANSAMPSCAPCLATPFASRNKQSALFRSSFLFPHAAKICTGTYACVRPALRLFFQNGASGLSTLSGQRLESGRADHGRRAGACFGGIRAARICIRRTENGLGDSLRLHDGRPHGSSARACSRAGALSPLRFRKFRDGQRYRERDARTARRHGIAASRRRSSWSSVSPRNFRWATSTAYC